MSQEGWHLIELVGGPADGAQRWMPDTADGPYYEFQTHSKHRNECRLPHWTNVAIYVHRPDEPTKYDYQEHQSEEHKK